MKKLFLAVLIMLVWSSLAMAATIKWDAPTGVPDGYIVYYAQGADQFSNDVGDRTAVDLAEFNLTPGTWVFYVTAYNIMGESENSNTAEYNMIGYTPSDNPKGVTFVIPGPVTFIIE